MIDIFQGTLVRAPFGTCDAHEPVVISLDLLDDVMGLSKCRIEWWIEHGTVREVPWRFDISSEALEGNISYLTPSLSGVFGLKFSVMYFWVN